MILETNFNEYVEIEFLVDLSAAIKKDTKMDAKCIRKMLNPGQYQLHTYRQQDPIFFISGTAEQLLSQVKFLEKKIINERLKGKN